MPSFIKILPFIRILLYESDQRFDTFGVFNIVQGSPVGGCFSGSETASCSSSSNDFPLQGPPARPDRLIVADSTNTIELVLTMALRVSRVSTARCKGAVKVMMRFKDEMLVSPGYGLTVMEYSATPM
jgi:hypothetical protein